MGCGASKSLESQVVQTTKPVAANNATIITTASVEATAPVSPITSNSTNPATDVTTSQRAPSADSKKAAVTAVPVVGNAPAVTNEGVAPSAERVAVPLTRSVMPSIPAAVGAVAAVKVSKAVAFEIILDEDAKAASTEDVAAPNGAVRGSLPKLSIDVAAKLANTEARWKDLEEAKAAKKKNRRSKPELSSTASHPIGDEDPIALKRRLLEKEAQAAQNRLKEIEKMQAKLARQEERARKVQERKKALGRTGSSDDLRLSWGGEDDGLMAKVAAVAAAELNDSGIADLNNKRAEDADSGKGTSRGGSGRSTGTVDAGELPSAPNVVAAM